MDRRLRVAEGGPAAAVGWGAGHYLAIFHPLYYTQLMTTGVCWGLLAACYISGFILALGLTMAIFQLSFCHGGLVHHVFCDLPAMLVLVCGSLKE
ncbi:hypothetical protein P7K49_014523 [Saguinus oedipus]|uniref:G-protein coupled receptors family 1 profile domain-containing protein n=1 Tax=Saguinus oedipus TaxID=9490 RepID=A0ABQ9VLA4_SAGOE|nr:hypothetical protein P7K49_014523 [Saguinus oedipus]